MAHQQPIPIDSAQPQPQPNPFANLAAMGIVVPHVPGAQAPEPAPTPTPVADISMSGFDLSRELERVIDDHGHLEEYEAVIYSRFLSRVD